MDGFSFFCFGLGDNSLCPVWRQNQHISSENTWVPRVTGLPPIFIAPGLPRGGATAKGRTFTAGADGEVSSYCQLPTTSTQVPRTAFWLSGFWTWWKNHIEKSGVVVVVHGISGGLDVVSPKLLGTRTLSNFFVKACKPPFQ